MDKILTPIPKDMRFLEKIIKTNCKLVSEQTGPQVFWGDLFYFPHGPFQELINGAKMALNCSIVFPTMAICGGRSPYVSY